MPARPIAAALTLMLSACTHAAYDFSAAEAAIREAIETEECPGAVLLVGQGDQVLFHEAFGDRAVEPTRVPMTTDTIFDMASLSKPIGCATSVLVLADRGRIDLKKPVATYLPEFGNNGKESITIEDLLLHRGGLIPDNPMSDYVGTRQEMIDRIMTSKPRWEPRSRFAYTDVGFIVLGELVQRVDGRRLDQFAHEEVFRPLGMNDTAYLPPADWKPRMAPTEKRSGEWMLGEVHDPRAYALGGVAGHAGLFGTAADVSRWVRMLNDDGVLEGRRLLSPSTVRQMLTLQALPDGSGGRGLGVDIASSYSGPRGKRFERGTTFGHTGWTGTSFWSDPNSDVYVILLTNRVHPDGKGDLRKLRAEVATACAEAVLGPAPTTAPAP
jgi:CubicO group peptidase (beta-lactamase class C family)